MAEPEFLPILLIATAYTVSNPWTMTFDIEGSSALLCRVAEAPICSSIAPTFFWVLASPNLGCWSTQIQSPKILPSVLPVTNFARPAGQLFRPPCREEGYTRLSVDGNKQLLWAAGPDGIVGFFSFLQTCWAAISKSNHRAQPQCNSIGAMRRIGGGQEGGRRS